MEDQPDKSIAKKEEVKKSDLQPKVVLLTAIISSVGTLMITQLSDLLKSVQNANNLKPDNNVHIIALKATAAKSDCPLINSSGLKSMATDPASMNHLSATDQFAVVLFAKKIPATIQSNQISSTLLTELKTRKILDSKCDSKPLDTLNVALVVSQPTPYVFNRKCDVLSRLDHVFPLFPPKYVNLGEVEIKPQALGTTSTQQTKSQTADNEQHVNDGPYNVLKETGVSWASFSSVRVKVDELTKMLNDGYLNVGLRCEFLYDKELKSKDIDYHKLRVKSS
jgi:hypothetical protein